ncbi:MAG TPA: hypothetical protein VJQ82_02535 [Terriglobales bacterium]|nr:hypothetical protein [Terriglobales bacterium]
MTEFQVWQDIFGYGAIPEYGKILIFLNPLPKGHIQSLSAKNDSSAFDRRSRQPALPTLTRSDSAQQKFKTKK